MKAKELMIGDLILENIDEEGCLAPCCWIPHQVNADDFKFWLENDWIDVDDKAFSEFWEPIPLTSEILEKNGWKSYSRENTPILGMIQGFEIVLALMDYYWQLCVDGTIYRKIKIRYVHELQHALRLCGIKKEITL